MKIPYAVFGLLVFINCSDRNNHKPDAVAVTEDTVAKAGRPDSLPITEKPGFKTDTFLIDTIVVDSFKLIISTITGDEYNNLIKNYEGYSDETCYTEGKLDKGIKRNNDELILDLKNGKKKIIKNTPGGEDGFKYSNYVYVTHFSFIHSYILAGSFYESVYCMMVNDSTGETGQDNLLQYFSIDPKHQRIITYYWDDWGLESGGFNLLEIKNGKVNLLFSYSSDESRVKSYNWSLSSVYFINQNEIAFIRQFYKVDSFTRKKCYSKMIIQKIGKQVSEQ